jgi:small-conductance mechanosensitive channel
MSTVIQGELPAWLINTMDPTRILLIILIILFALAIGLWLRSKLIGRLKKTVLDAWIVQTLGILVIIPSLIVAALIVPIIYTWSIDILSQMGASFLEAFNLRQVNPYTLLWNLAKTALLIALGVGAARTIRAVTIRGLGENRIDINTRMLIGRIFYILIILFAAFWILSVWDVALTIPVAFIGVITVAITVSIQEVLKDLAAGFYILIERPFAIGNMITIPSGMVIYTGKVEDVQLRATKLRLISGEEVSIPNSTVFTSVVTNNSYYGERRATITITLLQENYNSEETEQQILTILKENEHVMPKPEASILFSGYAEKKITLTLRFWIATEQPTTVSEVMHSLYTSLPEVELAVKEFAGNV